MGHGGIYMSDVDKAIYKKGGSKNWIKGAIKKSLVHLEPLLKEQVL